MRTWNDALMRKNRRVDVCTLTIIRLMNVMEIHRIRGLRCRHGGFSRHPPGPPPLRRTLRLRPLQGAQRADRGTLLAAPHGNLPPRHARARRGRLTEGRPAHPPGGSRRLRGGPGQRRRLRILGHGLRLPHLLARGVRFLGRVRREIRHRSHPRATPEQSPH